MDLDFGPTEAPSQPPKNPPPVGEGPTRAASVGGTIPMDKPASSQITFSPSGSPSGSSTVSRPQAAPTGSWTPPPPPPAAPQKSGRSKFLIVGIVIILAGLGYLAYSLLGAKSSLSGVTTTPAVTAPSNVSTLGTGTTATTPTVTPITPTLPSGGSATTGTSGTSGTTIPTPAASTVSETLQTRDAIRKKDLATIQTYLESYLTDKGRYPVASKTVRLNDTTATVVTALVPKYTAAAPRDPKDPEYFYGYKSLDGKTYTLSARLENTADPEGKTEGTVFLYTLSK